MDINQQYLITILLVFSKNTEKNQLATLSFDEIRCHAVIATDVPLSHNMTRVRRLSFRILHNTQHRGNLK